MRSGLVALALGGAIVTCTASSAAAQGAAPPPVQAVGVSRPAAPFNDLGPAGGPVRQAPPARDVRTIPWWQGSFSFGGQTYPYAMVGTDPADGPATTTVKARIVPLRLVFQRDGEVLHDPGKVADILASPVFTPVDLGLGPLQWHDLMQRISLATDPGYHVRLEPHVLPTQTVSVPSDIGLTAFDPVTERRIGFVTLDWTGRKARQLMEALRIRPTDLAVFLVDNVRASTTTAEDCLAPAGCHAFLGWHSAILTGGRGPTQPPPQVNTLLWASRPDFGAALPPGVDFRSQVLSHEVAEWVADPFLANVVPAYQVPFPGPSPHCQELLEVGEPVENAPQLGVPLPGGRITAMANVAMLSWFARHAPSQALFGLYDLGGVLTAPAASC
jgi:hypothetical protein